MTRIPSILMMLLAPILIVFSSSSQAIEIEHQLVRRLVVFPFQVPSRLVPRAEEAWWQIRQELTQNPIFLLASKQFFNQERSLSAARRPSTC